MAGSQEIGCIVDACHYWGSGDRCKADRIMVEHNRTAAPGGATMEVGTVGSTARPRATTSEHTCCRTFVSKNAKQ